VSDLPNGDLVTGSADTQVRVWTKDAGRVASDEVLKSHDDFIKLAEQAKNADGISDDMIADPIVLTTEGKPGEIKVVKMEEGPTVFQYDAQSKEWQKVGLAVGQAKAKPKINGVEYDHVTEVQIDDKSIKLGFNNYEDPMEVATAFCTRYGIDLDERINIVNHLRPFASAKARANWLKEQALEKDHTDVNLYYILSVLGTMAYVSETAKKDMLEAFDETLKEAIKKGQAAKTQATVDVANEAHKVMYLKV